MTNNQSNLSRPRHTCDQDAFNPCAACGALWERDQVVEYLEGRAHRLRHYEPTEASLRVADALEAEARRIARGDHVG